MNRRELIKSIAVITGATVVGGEFFISGCTTPAPKIAAAFSPEMISLLNEVGETIIPETDTPGAKAANVGEFMKVMITDCYTEAEQDAFTAGVNQINTFAQAQKQMPFSDCSAEDKQELLVMLEKEAKAFNRERNEKNKMEEKLANEQGRTFIPIPVHYYTMIKQLTLMGFFTSQTGMTETLRHIPVPGRYDGNAPYTKGQKAWAE